MKNKMKRVVSGAILTFSLVVFLVLFNFTTRVSEAAKIIDVCKKACEAEVAKGIDLESGPCLLNPIPTYDDWVCDVSHWPREPVDALEGNQCSEYGKGASHFVEIMPNCTFIRTSP